MSKQDRSRFLIPIFFVLGAAVLRIVLATVPNVSPLESMALFSGALIANRFRALLVPAAAWYVSDLVINNTIYGGSELTFFSEYMVYNLLSLIAIVLVGSAIVRKVTFTRVLAGSLIGSLLFFLITNFGSMLSNPMYTKGITGLLQSYVAGWPFYRNTVFSNLLFAGAMFGAYELAKTFLIGALSSKRMSN